MFVALTILELCQESKVTQPDRKVGTNLGKGSISRSCIETAADVEPDVLVLGPEMKVLNPQLVVWLI